MPYESEGSHTDRHPSRFSRASRGQHPGSGIGGRAHGVSSRLMQSGYADVDAVVARVPLLANAESLTAEVLSGGLTNTNYLVTADDQRYVVRIAGDDTDMLGIDRAREAAALRHAAAAGIAPPTEAFLLPEGHSVTAYLGDARTLTANEFAAPETVGRVARRIRDIHSLDPIIGSFDPYADIRRWMVVVDLQGITIPDRLPPLISEVFEIKGRRGLTRKDQVLCHNDPYHLNVLDDGALWFIDWEYAGMGDAFYDLAGVAYALPEPEREALLEGYFGSVTDAHRQTLTDMIRVFLCWNIVWSLVQVDSGSTRHDDLAAVERLLDDVP